MGIPADQEVLRLEIKNLTVEIDHLQKAILKKMQENPAANYAMAVSILVRWLQAQNSAAFALLTFYTKLDKTRVTKAGATASRICVQHILHITKLCERGKERLKRRYVRWTALAVLQLAEA